MRRRSSFSEKGHGKSLGSFASALAVALLPTNLFRVRLRRKCNHSAFPRRSKVRFASFRFFIALHIDKAIGDILGMAMFAVLIGIVRICYAKFGKNICRVLLVGMIGASAGYLVAGFSTSIVLAFLACVLTGLFTSMLWPGTLIMMEENIPGVGVTAYALMAAGGDLSASVSPQLMGIVIDKVSASSFACELSETLNLSAEQIGLKAGMLVSAIFPILGTFLVLFIIRYFKNKQKHII